MIVLDTHAWLSWVSEPARLGKSARRALRAAGRIGVPAICGLEVATAAVRGRITLDREPLDWLQEALALPRMELLPLSPAVAARAATLPSGFPGDPADRLIVATAQVEGALLVTKDDRLRRQPGFETVWAYAVPRRGDSRPLRPSSPRPSGPPLRALSPTSGCGPRPGPRA